ncbi:autophagy-related protein 18g isoform X1 [Raphanus sativus]|uniref:Autophagy-related protein 18g isoform X1 n=1 Tax=Raphanus sativus TaxID=3726 RepID=A0A6J0NEZ5_RAPSA|nr:autophagy-related protein 18g isoform X1 [Raphanus sativus]XP_018482721.1 autophagy-related protein 18g isoform X1 [Raphanus sativus]
MMKKGKGKNSSGLLPSSFKIISSCLKTVSANATNVASSVRSAGASVAASISAAEDDKDQVTWAGFGILELSQHITRHVLLLGYQNGFQVFDVEDSSNFNELVSKRGGAVSFLQMQPLPARSGGGHEGFGNSHPLLLVVAGDDTAGTGSGQSFSHNGSLARDGRADDATSYPTTVRFYSLRSHSYVYVLRFRSSVCMIRCSSRVVAVGLATQIYCFDALTLENKFSVLTYPVPQPVRQGTTRVNVGYGPMAVGPRWLAYASNSAITMKTGRLSPQSFVSSPSVSPSRATGGSSVMARYAMESSKQLANGLLNLGDMGYKTLSKYYQEMLPDGSSSPASPNSIWKVGGVTGLDAENAGMVAVKDLVSGAVVSQFKAHTSPISALCFDPSGTLLVTASVCGNNINVFQIMPSRSHSAPGDLSYECDTSHVHLFKLHRGITSAIVQDICFSRHSQWVAIISSKGTCHIFVLNPSGSDAGLLPLNCEGEEPARHSASTFPWWNTQTLAINQHSSPPPAVALSVVSRIKYSSFGWLNTVSNAATAATGKVFVPSGAVAAVFHKSVTHDLQQNSRTNSLEHILVYTPSGHVVQHELLPSVCTGSPESASRVQRASPAQVQEDDLRVKVEPIQWWDVCRRSDWLETEERLPKSITEKQYDLDTESSNLPIHEDACLSVDINGKFGEDRYLKTSSEKPPERSHCYLSNFEAKVTSGVLPVWQNSKISFHVMDSPKDNSSTGGESEIENVTAHELEIKQKKLLPVFDHFHSTKATSEERFSMKCYHASAVGSYQANGKICQDIINCHSKPGSVESAESSEEIGSSKRMDNFHDSDHMNNSVKSSLTLYPTTNGFYKEIEKENTNGFVEKPVTGELYMQEETRMAKHITNGFTTQPVQTDITLNEQILSTGKSPVNFGFALLEEHCKAVADPKEEHLKKSDEGANGNHHLNSNNTEKLQGDEMVCGMVSFVGD